LYIVFYSTKKIKGFIKPNKAIASVKAKPNIAKFKSCFLCLGPFKYDTIRDAKIKPIPTPAPT